ncbi:cytochrome P450 [Novosphingobium sp. TH158]|uniref:cytochrome P450 n=1 Tax=Novosphingobium sp. TH158 TaxID=2067455 RepID=UPI000C7E3618|nr:cytochrome P450 [Novosphingobium sp. TH158]PLK24370.1 cytochrome P450 [Novosphingobium sp. TH158]
MRDFAKVDFYTDAELVEETHEYFHWLRAQGPVTKLPGRNVYAVTGFDETIQLALDTEHFSTINSVIGAEVKLPFEPAGDDITAELEAARSKIEFSDQITSQQGKRHADLRSILARLFTPSRLRELEPGLRETADSLIEEWVADGKVEVATQYGGPYATLVIADVLGLPDDVRNRFRKLLEGTVPVKIGATREEMMQNPLVALGKDLFKILARRRLANHPLMAPFARLLGKRDDVLNDVATARFPDGAKPGLVDITALSAFLFGAGQDTTNRLLCACLKVIAERPDVQQALRDDPKKIPDFIEECLRLDGAVKSGGRICQKTTTLGGVEIKAGTVMMYSPMAGNRDPRRWESPDEFRMDRPKLKEHLAFGRGAHTCIGAPLARREVTVSLERLLARMGNIRLSEAHHGPEGARRFRHEPTYVLNALAELHLEFDPLPG